MENQLNQSQLHTLNIKHKKWYRPGMGTENVGPFLQSLMALCRPQRVLEIGVGYTTPFLIDGIQNNKNLIVERNNINEEFLKDYIYDPKMVIIDDNSLGQAIDSTIKYSLKKCKFLEIINGKFQGKSNEIYQKYGKFDFVWFDCGGEEEYRSFVKEYWEICSEYVIFHYTYSEGKPNVLYKAILENISPPFFRLDIIEPHKDRQGSITILRKSPIPILNTQ